MRISIPPVTRTLLGLTLVSSLLVLSLRYLAYISLPDPHDVVVPWIQLVPTLSIMYPWTLLTATFVETNFFSGLLQLSTLWFGGAYCESVWSSRGLVKFVVIQAVVPNVLAVLCAVFFFWLTQRPEELMVDFSGGTAIVSGFIVAFKQLAPEHRIVLFRGLVKFRVLHLPLIFLVSNTLLGLISSVYVIHAWGGFFVAWIYLRFLKISYADPVLPFSGSSSNAANATHHNPHGVRVRGDAGDAFALDKFFPEPAAFLVRKVSYPLWSLLVKLGVKPFEQSEIDSSNQRYQSKRAAAIQQPTWRFGVAQELQQTQNTRAEAERRRQLALRALDERMGK